MSSLATFTMNFGSTIDSYLSTDKGFIESVIELGGNLVNSSVITEVDLLRVAVFFGNIISFNKDFKDQIGLFVGVISEKLEKTTNQQCKMVRDDLAKIFTS